MSQLERRLSLLAARTTDRLAELEERIARAEAALADVARIPRFDPIDHGS